MKSTASITRGKNVDFYALKDSLHGHWLDLLYLKKEGDKHATSHKIMIARMAMDILVNITGSWTNDLDDEIDGELEELIFRNPATGYTVRNYIDWHITNQIEGISF